jgi:hypothetical protein
MSKKVLILTAVVLIFSSWEVQAASTLVSWDGGGDGYSWEDANNWNPNIVPDGDFDVTINAGAGVVYVGLQRSHNIHLLNCYGEVMLNSMNRLTPSYPELIVPGGLKNYGELEVGAPHHLGGIYIRGNVTNTTDATMNIWDVDICPDSSLYNQFGAMIEIASAVYTENLENSGNIVVDSLAFLNNDSRFNNLGKIEIYNGDCTAGEGDIADNNSTGVIQGFGTFHADWLLRNKGKICASGGSLAVISEQVMLSNTSILIASPASSLHITTQNINNFGTIEANAGNVAFDCNLVNESGGIIKLLGGTLAATTITQKADANFMGFGIINGNVLIESDAIIKITGPTNIVGDVNIPAGATLKISDGQTLITGHTTCDGTIHLIGGTVIFQGGCDCDGCNIINEAGTDRNHFDINADGIEDFKDFAYFANNWLWQASWY